MLAYNYQRNKTQLIFSVITVIIANYNGYYHIFVYLNISYLGDFIAVFEIYMCE